MLAITHCNTQCNPLQHAATHFATHCNILQHAATHCNTLHHTAIPCNTLQVHSKFVARRLHDLNFSNNNIGDEGAAALKVHCLLPRTTTHNATHCTTPQYTAALCNTLEHTLQHTAISCLYGVSQLCVVYLNCIWCISFHTYEYFALVFCHTHIHETRLIKHMRCSVLQWVALRVAVCYILIYIKKDLTNIFICMRRD